MTMKRKGGWPKGRPRSMSKEEWDDAQRQKQAAGTAGSELSHGSVGEVQQEPGEGGEQSDNVLERLEGGQGREGQEARPREVQQTANIPIVKKRMIINGRLHYCTKKEADRIMYLQSIGMPV